MFGTVLSGAQTTMHDWRMFRQLVRLLLFWALIVTIISGAWSGWQIWRDRPQQVKAATLYLRAITVGDMQSGDTEYGFTYADGTPGRVSIDHIRQTPAFRQSMLAIRAELIRATLRGAAGSTGVVLLLIVIFRWRGRGMQETKWLRGATLASPGQLNRITKRTYRTFRYLPVLYRTVPRFSLAGITWPCAAETRHTMIVGTTGSGKTVAMSALLDQIRQGRGKAVIYDKMGSFIPHYYRPGRDIILNPLDARSLDWDLFGEVRHEQDFDMIAAALIPAFKDTADPFWTTAARQLFASGAAALWKTNEASVPELVHLLLRTNLKDLAKRMQGFVEQSIIDPDNPKTALSVRAILSTALKPLAYMPPLRKPFSIRNWVETADDSFLFLSSDSISHESRKALIATQLELATAAMLSGEKDPDRRLWFIIDELPTLEQIPSLTSGLRESRQYGGCFVIGTQVVSELREIYGRNEAETISGNCNTRLILASPDMVTAEWCANALGRTERELTTENRSYGAHELKDAVSVAKRQDIKPAILASEIMELASLKGYIRFSGGYPVAKIRLKTKRRKIIAAHFEEADQIDNLTGEVYEPNAPRLSPVAAPQEPVIAAPEPAIAASQPPDDGTTLTAYRNTSAGDHSVDDGPAGHGPAGHGPAGHGPAGHDPDDGGWEGPQPSGPPRYFDDIPPADPSSDRYAKPAGKGRQRDINQAELDLEDKPHTADQVTIADWQAPLPAQDETPHSGNAPDTVPPDEREDL